jgi:hypothetical protein
LGGRNGRDAQEKFFDNIDRGVSDGTRSLSSSLQVEKWVGIVPSLPQSTGSVGVAATQKNWSASIIELECDGDDERGDVGAVSESTW